MPKVIAKRNKTAPPAEPVDGLMAVSTDPVVHTIELPAPDGVSPGALPGPIARLVWTSGAWGGGLPEDGCCQIVDLQVAPALRRRGLGSALLTRLVSEAREYFADRGIKLRTVWICLGHKHGIQARAYLTRHGFHHKGTLPGITRGQDVLVYLKHYR